METYLSLYFFPDFLACIDYSIFFYPHSIPIADFPLRVIRDQNALTRLFTHGAFFVIHLDSLFEHASPADHVVITLLGDAVVLNHTCADETSRLFFCLLSGLSLAILVLSGRVVFV